MGGCDLYCNWVARPLGEVRSFLHGFSGANVMGTRGPSPKATSELRLSGSWRAGGRAETLDVAAEKPSKPDFGQHKRADIEWDRIVGILWPKSALTALDCQALECLCRSWDDYLELSSAMEAMPKGDNDWKRVATERTAAYQRCTDLWRRFGMTPADRSRVNVGQPKGSSTGVRRRDRTA